MRTISLLSIVTLFILLLSSCDKGLSNTITPDIGECIDITVDENRYATIQKDDYTITSATLLGSCLKMVVTHGGGCGDRTFELITNGAIFESLPPLMKVKLGFINDDPCEALLTSELQFDIAPMITQQTEKVVIQLEDYDEVFHYGF